MKKEIEESKIEIENTKEKIELLRVNFLDKNKFDYLLIKFIEVMTNRILFCEKLIEFIEDKNNTKIDIDLAKDKIKEVVVANVHLQKKWINHFKKEQAVYGLKK